MSMVQRGAYVGGSLVLALGIAACGGSSRNVSARATPASATVRTATTTAVSTSSKTTATKPTAFATPSVGHCLESAGLSHVAETSYQRWQGVVGNRPLSDETASVFVLGPYSSETAVRRAVPTIQKGEIAAAGGFYLLVGSRAGHTSVPIGKASKCLRQLKNHRPKQGKSYNF